MGQDAEESLRLLLLMVLLLLLSQAAAATSAHAKRLNWGVWLPGIQLKAQGGADL